MLIRKFAKKFSAFIVMSLSFLTVFGFLVNPSVVHADSNVLSDNFNNLYLKPDPRASWWIINWGGDNSSGTPTQGRWEGLNGSASSAKLIKNDDEHFLRTSLFPQQTPGFFNNVDVAELHTGFPSEGTGKWTPAVGKPITLTASVRWSDNFKTDGSGTAIGTSGIWLWNSPFDLANYNPNTLEKGIGFNWVSNKSLGGLLAGLKATVVDDNNPVFFNRPTKAVDMSKWVNLKFVWSVDKSGVQSVTFFINGENLGTTQLPVPFDHLSVEVWNDNEDPQFTTTGGITINYANPTSRQNFDINSIKVSQDGREKD